MCPSSSRSFTIKKLPQVSSGIAGERKQAIKQCFGETLIPKSIHVQGQETLKSLPGLSGGQGC